MLSAERAKKGLPARTDPPRHGTRLRRIYDALLSGEVVSKDRFEFRTDKRGGIDFWRAIDYLRTFHNMDIRNVGHGQGYVLTCLYDDCGKILYDRYAPSEPRAA
jgi:hypothetical protein